MKCDICKKEHDNNIRKINELNVCYGCVDSENKKQEMKPGENIVVHPGRDPKVQKETAEGNYIKAYLEAFNKSPVLSACISSLATSDEEEKEEEDTCCPHCGREYDED
jgi:hypothetical protein